MGKYCSIIPRDNFLKKKLIYLSIKNYTVKNHFEKAKTFILLLLTQRCVS